MDCAEEQSMELEALESIFDQDFRRLSDASFEVALRPYASDDTEESHVGCTLVVEYPELYPTVAPVTSIRLEKGLNETQRQELETLCAQTAEENLNMAMVFTIAEAIKAWMMENNVRALTEHEKVVERKLQRDRERGVVDADQDHDASDDEDSDAGPVSHAIQNGHMLTLENFAEWKAKFDAEIRERWREEDQRNADLEAAKRMTGKAYFESHALSGTFLDAIERECDQQQLGVDISADLYQDDVGDDDFD